MKIYLDDLRTAPDATWTVCRNGDEFRAAVTSWCGKGDLTVSFDHDLGDECADTGHTLVKWLCEYLTPMMDDCAGNVTVCVHSANPVGAKNIRDYWEWFNRVCKT